MLITTIVMLVLSLIIWAVIGILGFSLVAIILVTVLSLMIMGFALAFGFSLIVIVLALIPFLLLVGYFTGNLYINDKRVKPFYIKK